MELDFQFLEKMYQAFKEFRANSPESSFGDVYTGENLDENGNSNDWQSKLYEYMLELRGFNKPVKIISKKEYDALKIYRKQGDKLVNPPSLYHGFTKSSYGYDYLVKQKYHHSLSKNVRVVGTFFTLEKDEALLYTSHSEKKDEKRILECKLLSSNGVRQSELRWNCTNRLFMDDFSEVEDPKQRNGMRVFFEFLSSKGFNVEMAEFRSFFDENFAVLAMLLGYDFYIDDQKTGCLINMNRGNLVTTPEEFEKFKSPEDFL